MGTYYQRRPSLGFGGFRLTPGVKYLLFVNAALYIFPAIFGFADDPLLRRALYLWPGMVARGALWQVFTYMFLHGGFVHFLFNMLILWMFGTAVEQTWGTRQFVRYYLACGLAAGLSIVAGAFITGDGTPTIGSSGAIFGVMVAFGMLFPEAPVLVMFIFPLPAKYFVILTAFIEFFLMQTQPGGPVSRVAHLGGMAFGFIYIKYLSRRFAARRPQVHSRGYGYPGYAGSPGVKKQPFYKKLFDWSPRESYKRWKVRRARRKFEVYMRRHQRDQDPDDWVQ